MNFLDDAYNKSLHENERNLRFWEHYLHNLNIINFGLYSDKLTVPTLVPIGSRVLFRGELKHTNEVTVALGADYFVKCSLAQAEVLRQHRIEDAQSKIKMYKKEREFLENRLTFSKKTTDEDTGKDIIELCSEEEDQVWREKHRDNVRKYHQDQKQVEDTKVDLTDEELWARLEELELQEELENELNNEDDGNDSQDTVIIEDELENNTEHIVNHIEKDKTEQEKNINRKTEANITHLKQTSKFDLLQQVLDKQSELEEKLSQLKNRETQSQTENDIMSRLDEMEQLEDLEDEMDRLDDILYEDEQENANKKSSSKIKRSVSFADEDDSETLELTFKHSKIEPCKEPYDKRKGISKPSDIYEAFSNLFTKKEEATSILRKSKYSADSRNTDTKTTTIKEIKHVTLKPETELEPPEERVIVVKDVKEKMDHTDNKLGGSDSRPTSLFKKRRQLQKS